MPDLRPFRGLRYDAACAPDLGAVLCPPYDVISPSQREELLARSPINAVRLELPSATTDQATAADFERAAETLRAWLGDGTLARDDRPMLYVYEQHFRDAAGAPRSARSFLCELRLEPYGPSSGVRPHERTLAGPREHRFALLGAARTHLSPVLLVYDDSDADQAALLDELTAGPARTGTERGIEHRLWAVDFDGSRAAQRLLDQAARRPLTIADGHHRYETALRYGNTPGAASGSDHVMALLYGSVSGGLGLAPWHRVIRAVGDPVEVVSAAVRELGGTRVGDVGELVAGVAASDRPGVAGVWSRAGGALLRWAESEPARLDVSVLSGTLPAMIGSTEGELTEAARLSYTHDAREAIAAVEGGTADVCLLLRPTPIEQVMTVAAAGEFMPPKSTYFYPKAATGLVFDPLDP